MPATVQLVRERATRVRAGLVELGDETPHLAEAAPSATGAQAAKTVAISIFRSGDVLGGWRCGMQSP
jgi:hypothetical protein